MNAITHQIHTENKFGAQTTYCLVSGVIISMSKQESGMGRVDGPYKIKNASRLGVLITVILL